MKCPLCKTEMRIKSSSYVQNEGKLFKKMIFTCRNKDCKNFGKEVKSTYLPLEVSTDTQAEESAE